ncbi:MAG: cache domain-containing protein [Lachnospiraceae bacterium]|nr:cache domain-containing protein [Lachnospiraceae bacterium]
MEGKKKFKLIHRLLLMSLVPILLLSIVTLIMSGININKGIQTEFLEGLKNQVTAVAAAYQYIDGGDYYLNEDGDLMKGNLNVTKNEALIDSFVQGTEVGVTLFYGDTRKATTLIGVQDGKRMVGTQASEAVAKQVLGGGTYEATDLVINTRPYMAYYMPMKNSDGKVVGMYFAGAPSEGVKAYVSSRIGQLVGISVILLIIAVIEVVLIATRIGKAIGQADQTIAHLSDGDLTIDVDEQLLKRNDEIGDMGRSLQSTMEKLRDIIGNINASASELKTAGVNLDEMASQSSQTTDDISNAVEGISTGAVSQAEEVERATGLVADMGQLIEQMVAGIDALYESAKQMGKAGNDARENMQELQQYNENTTEAINRVSDNVQKTDKSVEAISAALEMITDIADETNLLSLNASIEAARAGDAGRGFAVVAGQIQKLAEESAVSASRIAEIIQTLSKDSSETLAVMEQVQKDVEKQQEMMKTTMDRFDVVTEGIDSANVHTEQINGEAKDCDRSRDGVVDIIQNLSALSEENAASTEETTASMQELNATINLLAESASKLQGLATNLENDVKFFKV